MLRGLCTGDACNDDLLFYVNLVSHVYAKQELAQLDKEILQLTKELTTLKKEVGTTPLTVSDPCGGFSLLACVFQACIFVLLMTFSNS